MIIGTKNNIMKKYTIESRVSKIEMLEIKANSRKEAIKIAEQNKGLKWEETHPEERQLISIS